jgi:hypothetical protein
MAKPKRRTSTNESISFVRGLYREYEEQLARYVDQIAHLFEIEARVEVIEKNLCVTRDHLATVIKNCDEAIPPEWCKKLRIARFVGMRLADACASLLRARRKMAPDEMLDALNAGMFRFRTNAPAREIHAALLRQQNVKRIADGWIWIGTDEVQTALPLRVLNASQSTTNGGTAETE